MRSSSGPEIFDKYFWICSGEQWHSFLGSVYQPQGQGFIAHTSMNLDGKRVDLAARATVTQWSSRGWRSDSRTLRLNSGSSSRNRTPLWLNLSSDRKSTRLNSIHTS